MSESETAENSDQVSKTDNHPKKRVRHRKKLLYEKLLKQMEFYFSDANLSKDRFLSHLIKTDPFVPLEIFLKFNKVRALTHEVNDIAKAMKYSTLLELSEDRLKVKRKTEIQSYDAEIRTVYVESIPVTANREWLEKVFSKYGNVVYISLPKFKNSHRIKGYAFIEFEKPEDAHKCIHTLTKMGCKLPTSMPPEELSSIKTFSMDDAIEEAVEPKEDREEYEPPRKKNRKSKEKKLHKSMELKLSQMETSSDRKLITPSEENKDITTSLDESKTTDAESKDEATSQDERKNEDGTQRKKKARKKSSKDKKAKNKINTNEALNGALLGLQVLSKGEWKALRNKYLNLQRKYMKDMKNNLRNRKHAYSGIPEPAERSVECEQSVNAQETEAVKGATVLEEIPGVFVRDTLDEPCTDIRLTKRTIRSNVHVEHVEVKEGQTEVIIRFDAPKAADEYCAGRAGARVVAGGEQAAQWARARAALGARRERGRERVLRAARPAPPALEPAPPQPTHTHIRFDDEP